MSHQAAIESKSNAAEHSIESKSNAADHSTTLGSKKKIITVFFRLSCTISDAGSSSAQVSPIYAGDGRIEVIFIRFDGHAYGLYFFVLKSHMNFFVSAYLTVLLCQLISQFCCVSLLPESPRWYGPVSDDVPVLSSGI